MNKFRGKTVSITPFYNAPTLAIKDSTVDLFDSLFSPKSKSEVVQSTSLTDSSTLTTLTPQTQTQEESAKAANDLFFAAPPASLTPQESTSEAHSSAKLSIDELFQRHLKRKSSADDVEQSKNQQNEEIILFSKLDMNKAEDRDKWAEHLFQLSELATEVRNRFAKASALGRESDAKAGRTVWDRERRGTNTLNGSLKLIHPTDEDKENQKAEKAARKHKTKLNQIEKAVKDFLSLEETDESILAMFTANGKYSEEQIKGIIKRMKEEV